mgnify:CR=1 FL=1
MIEEKLYTGILKMNQIKYIKRYLKTVKQTFSISVIASISKVLNVPFEKFFKEN